MGKDEYMDLLAANGMALVWAEAREADSFTYLFATAPKSVVQQCGKSRV
jgi:hypothetical protein